MTNEASDPALVAVRLRDVSEGDLPLFFEHQRDAEANRMAAFPAREREAFLRHWHSKVLADPEIRVQTIVCEDRVAGNVLSFLLSGRRQVGYWLGREFWGRGIATRALSLFLEQVSERPLEAQVVPHNLASMRVLENCGFVRLGAGIEPRAADKKQDELLHFTLAD